MKIGESVLTQEFRKASKDDIITPISNETREAQNPIKANRLSELKKAQELKNMQKAQEKSNVMVENKTEDSIKKFQENLDVINKAKGTKIYASQGFNPLI